MASSYYNILNIPTSATQRDIKVAYRKLVQKHHPDVNKSGSDNAIKLINVAYETLANPKKKVIYDQRLLSDHTQPAPTNYRSPTRQPRSRRRWSPPHSFYRYNNQPSDVRYSYSTKTKLQMWGAVALTIGLIYLGIRGMNVFSSDYYFDKAEQAIAKKEYTKAFKFYKLSIRKWSSKNIEVSIKIVELNQQMEAYDAMVENCELAFHYQPDSLASAKLYYLEGIGYANTNRFTEAEWAYLTSLKYKFNKDSIYNKLGSIYLNHLANYAEAEKAYTYLLLNPINNDSDYYNRGISYQYLGQHSQAIKDFLIILKDDPYNGKVLFQLGRSYLALNQKEIACGYLQKAQNQGANIHPNEFAVACE